MVPLSISSSGSHFLSKATVKETDVIEMTNLRRSKTNVKCHVLHFILLLQEGTDDHVSQKLVPTCGETPGLLAGPRPVRLALALLRPDQHEALFTLVLDDRTEAEVRQSGHGSVRRGPWISTISLCKNAIYLQ